MLKIFFLLIGEGMSDNALVNHLQNLCILCGADEVQGVALDLAALGDKVGHTVKEKIKKAIELEPNVNLLFVHRDADGRNPEPRHAEINDAVRALAVDTRHVAIVPVQETEAWLLLDERAIRKAADNPRGRVPLAIPGPAEVENLAQPKEKLWELLREASELTGRKLDKFNATLKRRRRILIERLDPQGLVSQVPAWQRLRRDLQAVLQALPK